MTVPHTDSYPEHSPNSKGDARSQNLSEPNLPLQLGVLWHHQTVVRDQPCVGKHDSHDGAEHSADQKPDNESTD